MGKTSKDLPVLAIDSFQQFVNFSKFFYSFFQFLSMFLFENMAELHEPGKLRQVFWITISWISLKVTISTLC